MRRPNILLSAFTIMTILPALPALAQIPGQSNAANVSKTKFEQYPTFAQLSATDKDGTQTILRCGYSVSNAQGNNKSVIIDPEFHEITLLNPERHSYSRMQHIKDMIIATFKPETGTGLVVELVKPDGSVSTKSCQTDLNNDTIANCVAAQPMVSAAEIRDSDQKLTPQCSDLLQNSKADIKPDLANPQLAEIFKTSFTQKIQTLQAP